MSKDDFVDYYQLLGVELQATDDAIGRAYRAKIKQVHPDRHGGSSEAAKRLNEAREVLKDPAKRTKYKERWIAHVFARLSQRRKVAPGPTAPAPQPRASAPAWSPPPPVARTPPPPPPPAPPPPSMAHGGGGHWGVPLGLLTLLGGVLLLSSNGYDRRAGRYRGSDGTFRSGRFS